VYHENYENIYSTLKKALHGTHKKSFLNHGKEILRSYVELCTIEKREFCNQENETLLLRFHLTEGLSRRREITNTQPRDVGSYLIWLLGGKRQATTTANKAEW
jgi:hypothetical protein